MELSADKEILDAQRLLWEDSFREPDMFGAQPSAPAGIAAQMFMKENKSAIVELGGGQGRDTLFFAQNGLHVTVMDYSERAILNIADQARKLGLTRYVTAIRHDVREAIPFKDESFDGCYSHMHYCMALTTKDLQFLSHEVRRVLRPDGLHIFTVRHTGDPHYGKGIHRSEDMYEVDGFIVHFVSSEKIEHLAEGYDIVSINEFEEGDLPRRLFRVTLRKK